MNIQTNFKVSTIVKVWLIIGLLMILFQVVIGGVTRLTGSGLSITKWEIVTGTIPPITVEAWNSEFDKYKATPQYKKINKGMSLSEFKFIYFWEYFHRLWARTMGFVFLIPFLYFLWRKQLTKPLIRWLLLVVALAAVVALFGWIMVASGLQSRPWVSAYKLTIHLSLAFLLYGVLWWTILKVIQPNIKGFRHQKLKRWSIVITIVVCLQIMLGGLMSGMKAGLLYPTFPDMNGSFLPAMIFNFEEWTVDNFLFYDSDNTQNPVPTLVQVLHRLLAYVLTIIVLWFYWLGRSVNKPKWLTIGVGMLVTMLVIQVLLGIFTLINCIGTIPVGLGVLHQAGALLLLTVSLFVNYQFSNTE